MSEKHLGKGSTVPPYTGKLRLYSMRFCPYAQRVILVLNAKNLDYEVVNVNLSEKPEWLTSKSPLGKVPALEVSEDLTIYESLITADYVEDKYPEKPLTSDDPLRRAQDKLVVENFNKTIAAYYKAIFQKQDSKDDYLQGLRELQDALVQRGTPFIHGSEPGMVDYMVWPWFERVQLTEKFCGDDYAVDKREFRTLYVWMESMKGDEAVKKHYLPLEIHETFFRNRLNGINDYDFLL